MRLGGKIGCFGRGAKEKMSVADCNADASSASGAGNDDFSNRSEISKVHAL